MNANIINIASFPMPNEDTYYFKLYYDALAKYGYNILNTRGKKFDANWLKENKGKIQILHFHWPAYIYSNRNALVFYKNLKSFISNIRLAKSTGYKVAWTVHNIFPHERWNMLLEYLGRLALAWLSDVIFVHFGRAKKLLFFYFGRIRKVYLIPHGNFQTVFENNCTKEDARARLGIPANAFVYLLFGSIRHYKGVEDAMQAFKQMNAQDTVLLIAGSPSDKELSAWITEEAKADPRVITFLKFINKEDVQFYLNATDVVLLPYKNVFTSGNLFLALTFRKPLVAPDIGIISEVVDKNCGCKYAPDKKNIGLLEAMRNIREIDFAQTVNSAYEKTLFFDWEKSAEISNKAFKQILR